MNFDLTVVSRNTYNIFDLLSDIGGIQSILVTFFNLLLRVWNYNHLSNYLVSKLYKYKPNGVQDTSVPQSFHVTKMGNVMEYIVDIFSCRFSWCRRKGGSRTDNKKATLRKAREALDKEIDVIELIRQMRYVLSALNYLIPQNVKINELQEHSRFKQIDGEGEDSQEAFVQKAILESSPQCGGYLPTSNLSRQTH